MLVQSESAVDVAAVGPGADRVAPAIGDDVNSIVSGEALNLIEELSPSGRSF